jgi:aryl-phospho-beta-D-glucosidase BglC (GH1 family)
MSLPGHFRWRRLKLRFLISGSNANTSSAMKVLKPTRYTNTFSEPGLSSTDQQYLKQSLLHEQARFGDHTTIFRGCFSTTADVASLALPFASSSLR